jgi:hypothetical protein
MCSAGSDVLLRTPALRRRRARALASRTGGLLVRIDPSETDACLELPHVSLMSMGGRTMDGWIVVAPDGLQTDAELAVWVRRSLTFAGSLPAK